VRLSLTVVEGALAALDGHPPEVTPAACVATRYAASACRRCLDACPVGAITPGGWLEVDSERCVSCGACAAACRTGALAFPERGAALRHRTSSLLPGETVVVACAEAETDYADLVLACLGALSAADIVHIACAGAGAAQLISGACESCPRREAVAALPEVLEEALAAVSLLGRDLRVGRSAGPSGGSRGPTSSGMSRRGFFARLSREGARAVVSAPGAGRRSIDRIHAKVAPPQRHETLLDDVSGSHRAVPDLPLPSALPLAEVVVDASCDGCGLCVLYCPHGALTLSSGVARAEPRSCTACGLCAEVCPPSAVRLAPARPSLYRTPAA